MQLGVTGHQHRNGIDWGWVSAALAQNILQTDNICGLTSLADGSDQIFARVLLDHGVDVTAVIPLENYENYFNPGSLQTYRELVKRCHVIELKSRKDAEHAFLDAGKFIVDASDLLVAIWDGKQSEGVGGTADIVAYALQRRIPVMHLNPFDKSIQRI